MMVQMYRGNSIQAVTYLVIQLSIVGLIMSGLIPEKMLKVLQASQMVVVLMSKVRKIH